MSSANNQIYLVKDASKEFQLDLEKIQSQTGTEMLPLYVGVSNLHKSSQNDSHPPEEDRYLKILQELLDEFSEEDFKNTIDLRIHSERDEQSYNLSMKFGFTDAFVKKITSVLIEPKLSIRGKVESATEFLLPYTCRTSPLYNGKPFFGTFCATTSLTKKDLNVHNFDGASRIEHCIRTHVASSMSITFNFSVILLWSGFGGILGRETVPLFEKLMNDKLFMDCCIVASNKGRVFCHRSVVAAHSDVLRSKLESDLPEFHSTIEMLDISEKTVQLLVKYFYKNQVDDHDEMEEQTALELLQVAHSNQIRNLEGILVDFLFFKPPEWFSLTNILYLYRFTEKICEYELLRDKMLSILKKKTDILHSTEAFRNFSVKYPHDAVRLWSVLHINLNLVSY